MMLVIRRLKLNFQKKNTNRLACHLILENHRLFIQGRVVICMHKTLTSSEKLLKREHVWMNEWAKKWGKLLKNFNKARLRMRSLDSTFRRCNRCQDKINPRLWKRHPLMFFQVETERLLIDKLAIWVNSTTCITSWTLLTKWIRCQGPKHQFTPQICPCWCPLLETNTNFKRKGLWWTIFLS